MKRRRGRPSMKDLLDLLHEQDRLIEGLVELCEERGALIEQLTGAPTITVVPGINGVQH